MRPFREYIKLLIRPGLRRSLVEVFLVFSLVILFTATFFYMTGSELILDKFRGGERLDTLSAPSELIGSTFDEVLLEVKEELSFDVIVGDDELLDEIRNRFNEKISNEEFSKKLKEKMTSRLSREDDEFFYIKSIDQATYDDIQSPSVRPDRVFTVLYDRPIAILIPLLMIILAFIMASRILKPIKALSTAAATLAKGSFETPVRVNEEDEIGTLADMFERMRRNLRHKILELQNTTHELAIELEEKNVTLEQARALQKSFIPDYMEKGSIKIATELMLCDEVGGDFFDVLDLGGGKIAFIFGDVEGHGIRASFNMMSILTVFKVMAHENPDPIMLTNEINDMIWRERDNPNRRFSATAIVGLIDQHAGFIEFINSGHPNPILWSEKDKKVLELTVGNPLLGIQKEYQYTPVQMKINEGDKIFLYTDGLIWSTDTDGEYLGVDNLITILASDHDLPVEQLVIRISEKIRQFRSAKQKNDDDLLFTIFSFEPEVWSYQQIPPATKKNVLSEIIEYLSTQGISNDIISDFRLAMDELITNAMVHGNLNDPEKKVQIKYTVHQGQIRMVVQDEGEGFARDPSTFLLDRENIYESGRRGIYLVKSIMDDVIYNEKGNEVTIVKKITEEW